MDTLCVACAALTAALAGIVCAETPTAAKCFQSLNKVIIFGDSGYKVHKFSFTAECTTILFMRRLTNDLRKMELGHKNSRINKPEQFLTTSTESVHVLISATLL